MRSLGLIPSGFAGSPGDFSSLGTVLSLNRNQPRIGQPFSGLCLARRLHRSMAVSRSSSRYFEEAHSLHRALAATETSLAVEAMASLGYPQSQPLETIKPAKKGHLPHLSPADTIKTIRKGKANRKVFTALLHGNENSRNALEGITKDIVTLAEGNYLVVSNGIV